MKGVRLLSLALLVSLSSVVAGTAPCAPDVSEVSPFIGTWVLAMTNPAGAQETVRVWEEKGAVKASVQSGRFPAINATGILKDADVLVLTLMRFENGKPIRAVVALTVEGDTMAMAQMLERSETIKRGSGKRSDRP